VTYQLIFNGAVRSDIPLFLDNFTKEYIEYRRRKLNLAGLLLYTGGNFIFVLEGEKSEVFTIRKIFDDHSLISRTMVLIEGEISKPTFTALKIAYGKSDIDEYIPNSLYLHEEQLTQLLPPDTLDHTEILIKNFLVVNRVTFV